MGVDPPPRTGPDASTNYASFIFMCSLKSGPDYLVYIKNSLLHIILCSKMIEYEKFIYIFLNKKKFTYCLNYVAVYMLVSIAVSFVLSLVVSIVVSLMSQL